MRTLKLKQPQIIGLKELRENMEKYISRVKAGASFTIARRSQPIFEISPVGLSEDESLWETVVDFTTIDPDGVSAKEILRSLKKLHGTN
jgi:antitoxin (DNA-binding transcriptional repressor) of toxin-antitoxin stability system